MNKELIKKFQMEFNYCLNSDGEYPLLFKDIRGWNAGHISVFNTKIGLMYFNPSAIVINDEYVELRKALADNKTIYSWHYGDDGHSKWHVDCTESILKNGFVRCPLDYIIGYSDDEYVIVNGTIYKYSKVKAKYNYDMIKKWYPKQGELCLFKNNHDKCLVVDRLDDIEVSSNKEDYYKTVNRIHYDICYPYLRQDLNEFLEQKIKY